MSQIKYFIIFLIIAFSTVSCNASTSDSASTSVTDSTKIITGAEKLGDYLPLLKGKRIGVVANQTSMVGEVHLVDKLIAAEMDVKQAFAPEHGFRGEAGPGDKVDSGKDPKTGIKVISLYGSRKKPLPEDLKDIDIVVFDIQDVGARFYTYISTLHYVMEACAENNVLLLVLDRPNPNGFYVDGPVLDTAYRSFVGIAPIPVVHGLTIGEYALMANGEGWLKNGVKCKVSVVLMDNYTHDKLYELPVRPSPNLPGMNSIYLYPSLCFFEGAAVSVGRGTSKPFEMIGFPGYKNGNIKFTPLELTGIIKDPPYEGVECDGIDLSSYSDQMILSKQINMEWIIEMYKAYPDKEKFFNNFFDKLAGTDQLRKQITEGMTATEIRKSWQPGLDDYKSKRKKYLLYAD